MINGLIFGKFYPFHKGHEAMIKFALRKCDSLSVLICYDKEEKISGQVRKEWIERTFSDYENLNVQVYEYDSNELPNTSHTSFSASKIWANVFIKLYPACNLIITSEDYGKLVANFMDIAYLNFDKQRTSFPISASVIRSNPIINWEYLPNSVKPYYAVKVVLLGTESTGKSKLTEDLGNYFNCQIISEAGRDLIPDSKNFALEDLTIVAKEHAKRINSVKLNSNPLLIIDTDIHITKSYAQFLFQKELIVSDDITDINKANLYLYLKNDVPYVQDGTRLNEYERNNLDLSHRKVLKEHRIKFTEIEGSWQNRFEQAVTEVQKLFLSLSNEHANP